MRFRAVLTAIGLTLFLAAPALAVDIYRSVGPGRNSVLASATSGLTISGTTATFVSPVPDNVGVGDAIQYDTTGNSTPDALAFIVSRTDSTHYTVQSAAGGAPTATSTNKDWAINRAYTSLANVHSATENTLIDSGLRNFDSAPPKNLVSLGQTWHIACYAENADSAVSWNNDWTTDATHYIQIYTPHLLSEAGASQRHNGAWNTGAYYIEVSNATALAIHATNVRVEGLQIAVDAINADAQKGIDLSGFANAAVDIQISHCLIRGAGGWTSTPNWHYGISEWDNPASGTIRIWNNIIYDFNGTPSTDAALELKGSPSVVVYVYSNTLVNCYNGLYRDGGTGTVVAINNIVQQCVSGFTGSYDASSNYNLSDLAADAPGGNSVNNTPLTFAGAANYHLAAVDAAAHAGTDLSGNANLAFTDDIDGDGRTGTWDIGADQFMGTWATKTATSTLTVTNTPTPTDTPSATPSITLSATPTLSLTPSATPSITLTATPTPTLTASATLTRSPTVSPSSTISPTVTITPTITHSPTHAPSSTLTPTTTLTVSLTCTMTRAIAFIPPEVLVYPNPYRADIKPKPEVRFVNLPNQATIQVFDLAGNKVVTLEKNDSLDYALWNLQNQNGKAVASGVYIFHIHATGGVKKGKLALLR